MNSFDDLVVGKVYKFVARVEYYQGSWGIYKDQGLANLFGTLRSGECFLFIDLVLGKSDFPSYKDYKLLKILSPTHLGWICVSPWDLKDCHEFNENF